MSNYMSGYNLQSIQGPSDDVLRNNAVEGYTQVSRVGEVVINTFVDTYEYAVVPDSFKGSEMLGTHFRNSDGQVVPISGTGDSDASAPVESRPHFYEWATATTGMLAVTRRMRSTFRNYVAAETACPIVCCAACRGPLDEVDFQFAGVVRSNSIRQMDDGVGPKTDEYFTLAIGGMATILNNSNKVVHPGDMIAWTFVSEADSTARQQRRKDKGPRRIGIRVADYCKQILYARIEALHTACSLCSLCLLACVSKLMKTSSVGRSHSQRAEPP